MDLLNQIISSLKKEELRFFKLFASRSHGDSERKDLQLFDYVRRAGSTYDETEICTLLYPSGRKNSFYRLKHRLMEELNKSLWLQHFEEDPITLGLYLYTLSKLHYDQGRLSVAHHFLKRAERQAQGSENFEVLDLIYGLFIRLSFDLHEINPEPYIQLRQENRKKLEVLSEIDDLLAMVTYKLKVSMNYGARDTRILNLLQETLNEYSRDSRLLKSTKFRIKVYEAVSRLLLQQNEFNALESYLKTTFEDFRESEVFSRQTHDTKLQMLAYLINTLNKNNKYEEALAYLEVLKDSLEAYGGLLHDKYQVYYYNALFETYFGLDDPRAVDILLKFKQDPETYGATFNLVFIYANLSLCYYRNGQHREALRNLIELYLLEDYKSIDNGLKLKIEVFELVLRYLGKAYEVLAQRMRQIQKDYAQELSAREFHRDVRFVELLGNMTRTAQELNPQKKTRALLQDYLESNIEDGVDPDAILDYDFFVRQQLQLS